MRLLLLILARLCTSAALDLLRVSDVLADCGDALVAEARRRAA
jgi:hypothetical protein